MLWRLAFRNLSRQTRRYGVIFLSLVFGFGVVVLVLGLTNGMDHALDRKAARYFAGDISITAYVNGGAVAGIEQQAAVEAALWESGVPLQAVCRRTNYLNLDSTLFFNGEAVRQRRLVGVDWAHESGTFADLDFLEGGLEGMAGSDGVLVSSQFAAKSGARVGDEVLLLLTTVGGAQNTARLVLRGIYRESSFFGSTCYLDIDTLNRLWGMPQGSVSDMGAMLAPGVDQVTAAARIRQALVAKGIACFDPIDSREAQMATIVTAGAQAVCAVMTLRAHISQISDLLLALRLVTLFVLLVFMLIAAVGISSTFRMVVRERVREIGTLRAMGMSAGRVRGLFVREALLLCFAGSIGGILAGCLLLVVVSQIDLSSYALLLMFLRQGHPVWYLPLAWLALAWGGMLVSGVLGVFGAANEAAKVTPLRAMNDQL